MPRAAGALRVCGGIVSFLVPVGFVAMSFVEPFVWPRRGEFFDAFALTLGVMALITLFGFIWYARRSPSVPNEKRSLWVIVLLFGSIFALPLFWFWYVRKGQGAQ